MGKNKKKGPNANVFKVAGAKSLKKPKAKAVNLGLKNIKQKIAEIDKQFIETKKDPRSEQSVKLKEIKMPPQQPAQSEIKAKYTKNLQQVNNDFVTLTDIK